MARNFVVPARTLTILLCLAGLAVQTPRLDAVVPYGPIIGVNGAAGATLPNPAAVFLANDASIGLTIATASVLFDPGGIFASNPTAAQSASGVVFVAARDGYNSLWENNFNTSSQTWGGGRSRAGRSREIHR